MRDSTSERTNEKKGTPKGEREGASQCEQREEKIYNLGEICTYTQTPSQDSFLPRDMRYIIYLIFISLKINNTYNA